MAYPRARADASQRRRVFAKSNTVSTITFERGHSKSKRTWSKPKWSRVATVEVVLIVILALAAVSKVVRGTTGGAEATPGRITVLDSTRQGAAEWMQRLQKAALAGHGSRSDAAPEDASEMNLSKYNGISSSELVEMAKGLEVKFHIIVLAMNRPEALQRLLDSVKNAHTDGDHLDLTIWIDLPNKAEHHDPETVRVAEEFSWPHGNKSVNKREVRLGLIKNWLTCWSVNPEDPTERPIILEDDLEVSPLYYRWIKAAVAKYDHMPDVSSYTLQRVTLCPTTGQTKGVMGMNEGVFLYRLLGTWGFSPKPTVWKEFQDWYNEREDNKSFVPHVTGLKINDWYHGREWSNWFIRYTDETNTYVLHPLILEKAVTLVGNWREPGEHYGNGPAKGLDFPVLQEDDDVLFRMPDEDLLVRLEWDGKPSPAHHSGFYRDHKDSLDNVIRYAKLENGGQISFSLVNMNFMPFAKSFICNVDQFKIRPKGLTWVTNDKKAYDELRKDGSYHTVLMEFSGGESKRGTTFGTPGYWELMISRAKLVLELLNNNITVLLFDADQVWLQDPMPYVDTLLEDPAVDVVGITTSQDEVGGNFVYMRPSQRVKDMYKQLVEMFEEEYEKKGIKDLGPDDRVVIQNDQTLLSSLIHRNEKWKAKFGCVFRSLDPDHFPDGRWYKGAYRTNPRTFDPVLVNNNFVEGNEEKIKRAVQYGHWFYDAKHHKCVKNETTKYYAEDGKFRYVPLKLPWEREGEQNSTVTA